MGLALGGDQGYGGCPSDCKPLNNLCFVPILGSGLRNGGSCVEYFPSYLHKRPCRLCTKSVPFDQYLEGLTLYKNLNQLVTLSAI